MNFGTAHQMGSIDLEQAAFRIMASGRLEDAISQLVQAILLDSKNSQWKKLFVQRVGGRSIPGKYSEVRHVLEICFKDDDIHHQSLLVGLLDIFSYQDDYLPLRRLATYSTFDAFEEAVTEAQIRTVAEDSLLLAALPVLYAANPTLERVLTHLRRHFAKRVGLAALSEFLSFLSALGLHCFQNEYVFLQHPVEDKLCQKLKTAIETADTTNCDNEALIAVYSSYQPLAKLENAQSIIELAKTTTNAKFAALVKKQIIEPLQEEKIKIAIPVLTDIKDPLSVAVRKQYEENPYPRWLSQRSAPRHSNGKSLDKGKTFLNAGCGTGQSPISFAKKYPNAHVTGIDLSLSSLAYAQRKAAEMDVENISFAQADILELRSWDKKFDVITSGGVLHHLNNPKDGWRVLVSLLKPDGVLKLGLYSERARRSQAAGQKWIKENNIPQSPEGIRAFRKCVFQCGKKDPKKPIAGMIDFYSMSNCRDLVFNLMEHRFTCTQLLGTMDELGVKFLGFTNLGPRTKKRYQAMFPNDPNMRDLRHWDLFEQNYPATFAEMYQFWCCRKDERPENDLPAWLTPRRELPGSAHSQQSRETLGHGRRLEWARRREACGQSDP